MPHFGLENNSQSKASMFTPLQFLQSGIIDHLGSHWCFSKPGTRIVFVHFNAFKLMIFFSSNPTIQTAHRFFVILHQWHQFLFTGRDAIVLVISDKRLGSTELAQRFALCVHLEITQRMFDVFAYPTVRGLTDVSIIITAVQMHETMYFDDRIQLGISDFIYTLPHKCSSKKHINSLYYSCVICKFHCIVAQMKS